MKLKTLYGRLSSENRIQFWTITSTMLSTVLTFWLGFTIQYFVLEKGSESEEEYEQNLRFQLVNHIYPIYQQQHIENTSIINSIEILLRRTEGKENDERLDSISRTVNFTDICVAATNSAYIMDKARFCFDKDLYWRISRNNMKLLVGAKFVNMLDENMHKEINKSMVLDSISLARRVSTMKKDNAKEDSLANDFLKYISGVEFDENTHMADFSIPKIKITGDIILPALEDNEDIMNHQLHQFIREKDEPSWSMGFTKAFYSIKRALVSGSNFPHLIYSIIMLCIIFLIGFVIWAFVLRLAFTKEDPEILKKTYSEVEQEINSLKEELKFFKEKT